MPTAAPVDPKTYVIGPEDILAVRVWREPELSGAVQVRPDGKITLPLVGEMQAAGETPEGLKTKSRRLCRSTSLNLMLSFHCSRFRAASTTSRARFRVPARFRLWFP